MNLEMLMEIAEIFDADESRWKEEMEVRGTVSGVFSIYIIPIHSTCVLSYI